MPAPEADNRAVVVTGANRGIGLALCHHYQQCGCRVYAVCRQSSPSLTALGMEVLVEVLEGIDITAVADIAQLVVRLDGVAIDILINNAGIIAADNLGTLDKNSLLTQMETNALAPLLLTEALVPQLTNPGRLVFISSIKASLTANTSSGRYGYRMSKAALNMAARCLAHDLKPAGIAVAMIHPGSVSTQMSLGQGELTVGESVAAIAKIIEELNLENSGLFWGPNAELLPW